MKLGTRRQARRLDAAEFVDVAPRRGAAGRTVTTREMIDRQRDTIARIRLNR